MLTLLAVQGLTETPSACSTTTAEDGIDDVDDDCDGSV